MGTPVCEGNAHPERPQKSARKLAQRPAARSARSRAGILQVEIRLARPSRTVVPLSLLLGLGVAAPAAARDPGPDIQQFRPVLDMHGFALLYDASLQPALRAGVGVYINGAVNPLEVNAPLGRQFGVVDGLLGADLVGVFGITDWLEVGGTLPIAQIPRSTEFLEHLGGSGVGWSMGDVRFEGRIRIVNPAAAPVGVAANVFVNLPTGNELAGLGRGLPSAGGRFVVAQRWSRVHFAANFGFGLYAPATLANLTTQHEFTYGVGVGLSPAPGKLDINLELDGSLTGGPSEQGVERFGDGPHSPLELLVGVRGHLPRGFSVYGGAGKGLTVGFGSPRLRVFVGVQWALRGPPDKDGDGIRNRDDVCRNQAEDVDGFEDDDGCPEPDNDGDGVFDLADACPLVSEDRDGFEDADGCPEFDNDLDGLPDTHDPCPLRPEDVDGFQDHDGCPDPDNDGDGIADVSDRCPMDHEDFDGFDDLDGCPEPDNDGDGVFDLADLCPLQPEAMDGFRDADGCPDDMLVVLAEGGLIVYAPITFDRRQRLAKEADEPLGAIADLLLGTPGLRLQVAAHTDGRFKAKGIERSAARAEAVRERLIALGAPAERLDAVGYGALQPRVSGTDAAAKAENERVEFLIIP